MPKDEFEKSPIHNTCKCLNFSTSIKLYLAQIPPLKSFPNVLLVFQDSSVTYSSTEETRQTGNNVRSKRPVSFSSDEEEDLNMEKRTRRDQDTDSMDT